MTSNRDNARGTAANHRFWRVLERRYTDPWARAGVLSVPGRLLAVSKVRGR